MVFLYISGIALGDFDIYHAEVFMNDVATNGELDIDYIAGKLATYSYSSQRRNGHGRSGVLPLAQLLTG